MEFADLQRAFHGECFELDCEHPEMFHEGDSICVDKRLDSRGVIIKPVRKSAIVNDFGEFVTDNQAMEWSRCCSGDYMAQVTAVSGRRLGILAISGYRYREMQKHLSIAATDKAIGHYANFSEFKNSILKQYTLQYGEQSFCIIGRYISHADSEPAEVNDGNSFVLVDAGRTRFYSVKEVMRGSLGESNAETAGEKVLVIESGERPFHSENYQLLLCQCTLDVEDRTSVAIASAETRAFMSKGLEKYISLWRDYSDIEYDFIVKTAEKAGELKYELVDSAEGLVKIKNPEFIQNFINGLSDLGNEQSVVLISDTNENWKTNCTIDGIEDSHHIRLRRFNRNREFPNAGRIIPDINAGKTQHSRRAEAFDRTLGGRSAKPNLAMLISGEGVRPQKGRAKYTPLSEKIIKEHFGEKMPTDSQLEAIRIALNTPDFAIIQGPPGTGKTTVINAIMTALSEKEKDPEIFFGQNLLTAYQRDATDHLAEKMRIFGLPILTFKGLKQSEPLSEIDDVILRWIEEKRLAMGEINQEANKLAQVDIFLARVNLIRSAFNENVANREMAKSALNAFVSLLDDAHDLDLDITPYLAEARRISSKIDLDYTLRARIEAQEVRCLPSTEISMQDDGINLVSRILSRVEQAGYGQEVNKCVAVLRQLYEEEPISFAKIKCAKNELLFQIEEPENHLVDSTLNRRILDLIDSLLNEYSGYEENDETRLIAEYISAFESPENVKESVKEFITAIAATHQIAASKAVLEQKSGYSVDYDTDYDNVLIDEAARSCPPDLLIPLSAAKERMILVGDQCQLPQFVSEKVYDAIDGIPDEDKKAIIKDRPMFSHLIEQVQKLERADGIKRFVPLDHQFRMPKILADLVSRNFYEKDGLVIQSDDEIGPDKHGADLKYLYKQENGQKQYYHMLWLDVPGNARTREKKNKNGSYERAAEAERIYKMFDKVVEASGDKAKNYSFGIMTFYNGQKQLLQDEFKPYFDDEEKRNNIRKIEIGTVDSFQGKEFDVVFLSLVRSNTDYLHQSKRFGFTTDERRLCVALSRAKRCMIVAGDSKMMRQEFAAGAVPALVDYYNQCADTGVKDARVYQNKDDLSES